MWDIQVWKGEASASETRNIPWKLQSKASRNKYTNVLQANRDEINPPKLVLILIM